MIRNKETDIKTLQMLINKHMIVSENNVCSFDETNLRNDADDYYIVYKFTKLVNFLNEDFSNRINDDLEEIYEFL